MKPSEILRKAAYLVESVPAEDYCGCYAIMLEAREHAPKQETDTLVAFEILRPPKGPEGACNRWWGLGDEDARILGLCLAAAIAESEGQ